LKPTVDKKNCTRF
jgi:hypothetical protein